jgi:iron complex transport system substrate-binding protein
MTEILFALNAGSTIVGVTTFCDYPSDVRSITKVGDFSHPSIERIVALKPHLVVVNLPEQKRVKQELEKLHMHVFVSSPASLSDIYNEIAMVGKIVNREPQADSLIDYMRTTITKQDVSKIERVYVELSPRPIVTIGAQTFLNELLTLAGGTNIFSDINQDYPIVSQEEIIRRDPEIIIVLHPEDITDRLGWQHISALQKARVYTHLNPDHLMRAGPRLVQGFDALKKVLSE